MIGVLVKGGNLDTGTGMSGEKTIEGTQGEDGHLQAIGRGLGQILPKKEPILLTP